MIATVSSVLSAGIARLRASGSESPNLDAELLLGMVLRVERTTLRAHPEATVGADAHAAYEAALARREAGEPVAYIRGFKEFHGLALGVDARALIPRPETETLVDAAEAEIMRRLTSAPRGKGAPPLRVADVGTGSGAIAIALVTALRRRGADGEIEILATDASPDALDLARENAVGHAVADRMRFAESDLLPATDHEASATTAPPAEPAATAATAATESPFDVVLANLPYVRSDAVDTLPIAASFEPRPALDGGPDGLAVIRRLLGLLPTALTSDGVALLEIGGDQGDEILDAVGVQLPGWSCVVLPDLGGLPRVARIERPAPDG